ncbi:MAG: ExeA family protein [Gammaproteobacteria bacterium]
MQTPIQLGDATLAMQPFDNTRDPQYFFASAGHAEAISRLQFLIEDGNMGMGMLTGEIGCGKTLTRTVLQNRIARDAYTVVTLENAMLGFDDLLLEIISQVRRERVYGDKLPDRYSRMSAFKQALMRRVVEARKHLVILLDEAQQLNPANLEAVKSLTNIASERTNFLTIILIGQPELRGQVKALPQVDQRISLRYHLNPLSPVETEGYVKHRFECAGLKGEIPLSEGAIRLLSEFSGGIPREINRIAKLALDHAVSNDLASIEEYTVRLIVDDLIRQGGLDDPAMVVD